MEGLNFDRGTYYHSSVKSCGSARCVSPGELKKMYTKHLNFTIIIIRERYVTNRRQPRGLNEREYLGDEARGQTDDTRECKTILFYADVATVVSRNSAIAS